MIMAVLNPFSLPSDYTIIFDEPYLGIKKFDQDVDVPFKIIKNNKTLIMQKVRPILFGRPNIPGYTVFQIELPLSAAKWLVDTIENKLWKSAAQGGLPSGVNSYKGHVEGEKLALYRQMHVEDENQKGFLLTNFSRKSPMFRETNYQDFHITDWMLIDGKLLDFLKTL
ncbi:hypothetical protein VAZ01S_039_00680 [Vibrio azureus NBRC 104587]|uniref:Uncharacterized protein n=2 Tax=Vibrio azureus TaxID=512649 RepID=U3C489_9VIBR|nr:hypothetical protein VAZ01S_039_00680 [Vibrio azureus NBRC 104587]